MRPPQGATQTDQGLKSLAENEICSGRGDGAGCQSMARSTIWRIRSNHHCGSRRDERRLVAGAGHARRVLKLSSNCALVIGDLSFCAQDRREGGTKAVQPYKYGYADVSGRVDQGPQQGGGSVGAAFQRFEGAVGAEAHSLAAPFDAVAEKGQ